MNNTLTSAELKRRGMAAIEEGLARGPIQILKRNKPTAIILSPGEYQRLIADQTAAKPGMTALQWLLLQSSTDKRDKAEIDAALGEERSW